MMTLWEALNEINIMDYLYADKDPRFEDDPIEDEMGISLSSSMVERRCSNDYNVCIQNSKKY